MVRISEEEAKRLGIDLKGLSFGFSDSPKPKKRKYKNQPCELDGLKFDSQKERDYFLLLRDKQQRGEISELRLQVRINLQEGFTTPEGKKIKPIDYIADFTYLDSSGQKHIIDVKGGKATQTAVYKLKKKLLADKGLYIEEV